MKRTKQQLMRLWGNDEKRREFLKDYKQWGVWLTVPELGLTYYKFELPGKLKILAMEYQCERYAWDYENNKEKGKLKTIAVHYLWDGKYFIPQPASEYTIVDRLKKLKAEFQAELKAKG